MSLVARISRRQVASLSELNKLALKKIFDKKNLTYEEEALLETSIDAWPKNVDLTSYQKKELQHIIGALLMNEAGKFYKIKEQMIKHNLDYRKVYDAGI